MRRARVTPWSRLAAQVNDGRELEWSLRPLGVQEQPAMTPYQAALAVFLGTATAALPSAAQHVSPPPILASQACAGCFAYLEFAPQLEPESHAMRGEATETSA